MYPTALLTKGKLGDFYEKWRQREHFCHLGFVIADKMLITKISPSYFHLNGAVQSFAPPSLQTVFRTWTCKIESIMKSKSCHFYFGMKKIFVLKLCCWILFDSPCYFECCPGVSCLGSWFSNNHISWNYNSTTFKSKIKRNDNNWKTKFNHPSTTQVSTTKRRQTRSYLGPTQLQKLLHV